MGRVNTPTDMRGPLLVRVISSTSNGDNTWDYQVQIANWKDSGSIAASEAPAKNIWEKGNTITTAMGLPAGTIATLQPCPNETYVLAWYSPSESGYLFQWPNQWECN